MSRPPLRCVVSVSGARGVVGQDMDPATVLHLAACYGRGIARAAAGGTVILGRDSRPTGAMLAQAAAAGLRGVGCQVIDIGVVPTPTVPIMIKQLRAQGGIQISASHNPVEWNALKLFNRRGRNIDRKQLAALLRLYEDPREEWQPWSACGGYGERADALDLHRDRVLAAVDVELVRSAGFKVLVDSVNGAGSRLAGRLLAELGCEVVPLYADPDQVFPREPEPTAANVKETGKVVKAVGAIIGFVQDPDADRLALIDGKGRYIGEEYTLALCAAARLAAAKAAGAERPVACTNLSTSRMIDDVALALGGRVVRSAVGEANVVDAMQANDAVIGGEGNGGVIDPRVVAGRDSHIGMALVLEHLARQRCDLVEAVATIPRYAMHKQKLPLDRQAVTVAGEVLKRHRLAGDAEVDEQDGLKLSWSDRWVHLRASGTEPVSRLITEAPTPAEASSLARQIRKVIAAQGA